MPKSTMEKGKGKAKAGSALAIVEAAASKKSEKRSAKRPRRNPASHDAELMFCDDEAKGKWGGYEHANVLPGRSVRFDDFHRDVTDIFRASSWTDYLKEAGADPCYDHLVRLFYCNLRWNNYGEPLSSMSSYVLGIELNGITADLLCEVTNTPVEGVSIDQGTARLYPEGTSRIDFLTALCAPNPPVDPPTSARLNDTWKAVHLAVTYNILPKGGDRGKITHREEVLLSHLYAREPINLGQYIEGQMWDVTRHISDRSRALPYGTVITRLLRHFGVPLEGMHKMILKQPIDTKALHRMKASGTREAAAGGGGVSQQTDLAAVLDEVRANRDAQMSWMRRFRRNVRDTLREIRNFNRNIFHVLKSVYPNDRVARSLDTQTVFGDGRKSWVDTHLSDSDDASKEKRKKAASDRRSSTKPKAKEIAEEEEELQTESGSGTEEEEESVPDVDTSDSDE